MSKFGSTLSFFPSFRVLIATVALLSTIGMYPTRSGAATCPAAATVMRAGSAFIAAAHSGTLTAFSSALAQHADVRGAALFALGQYRPELPPARQREFLVGAQSYMARFLMQHASPFRSSRYLVIESCRGNVVETSLDGRSRMKWRLSGGRVKDVQVSGVWLAIELRSKFTSILRQHNGNMDALLDYLAKARD